MFEHIGHRYQIIEIGLDAAGKGIPSSYRYPIVLLAPARAFGAVASSTPSAVKPTCFSRYGNSPVAVPMSRLRPCMR